METHLESHVETVSSLQWSLRTFKIKDLKEYHKNPRKISKDDFEHLKTSIKTLGLVDKPAVTFDGLLIGGHQRVRALNALGYKEVPCWVPSRPLTEKEIEEANIRFNKNQGEWDFDILANEWDLDSLIDWGFTPDEFQIDLESMQEDEKESQKDPDEVNLEHKLIVEVQCLTERDQKKLYDELVKRGYECRILSL